MRRTSNTIDYSQPVNWSCGLNQGLMAWQMVMPDWRGGNTWRDLTGRYHGVLTSMDPATAWVAGGRPGGYGALNFDGVNDRVVLTPFPGATTQITMAQWVYVRNASAFTYGSGVNSNNIYYQDAVSGFYVYNTSGLAAASKNIWYHLVHTHDGTTGLIYLNGIAKGTDPYALGTATETIIGDYSSGVFVPLDGMVDDFRISNRCFSAGEVKALYTQSCLGHPQTLNRIRRQITVPGVAAAGGGPIYGSSPLIAGPLYSWRLTA